MTVEKKNTSKYNRNVRVSVETLQEINIIKQKYALSNQDSVIQFLIQQLENKK